MARKKPTSKNKVGKRGGKQATRATPSSQAWFVAVILALVLILGLFYWDKNAPLSSQWAHAIPNLASKHFITVHKPPPPSFDFYTDLPKSGDKTKLAVVETKPSLVPTTIKQTSPPPLSGTGTSLSPEKKGQAHYFQIAAFKTYLEADNLKATLLLAGFNVNIVQTEIKLQPWYRVIIGPYAKSTALSTINASLLKAHIKAQPFSVNLSTL